MDGPSCGVPWVESSMTNPAITDARLRQDPRCVHKLAAGRARRISQIRVSA